jgi:hypothetical protein
MRAWRSVAVVLRYVKRNAVAADLHVQRCIRLETVFPVYAEPKPIHVELARLGLIVTAQDRHRAKMGQRHCRNPLSNCYRATLAASAALGYRAK